MWLVLLRNFGNFFKIAYKIQFSSVQSLSRVRQSATPWIAACQASLFITNSWSPLRLEFIESVMPSSHLILCRPLLLLPPIPPSIRVFSSELTLRMRWPKYWRADSFEMTLMLGKTEGRRRRGQHRMRWLKASIQWTWVWVDSRSWWWTGRPGMLQFMGLQRVRHN